MRELFIRYRAFKYLEAVHFEGLIVFWPFSRRVIINKMSWSIIVECNVYTIVRCSWEHCEKKKHEMFQIRSYNCINIKLAMIANQTHIWTVQLRWKNRIKRNAGKESGFITWTPICPPSTDSPFLMTKRVQSPLQSYSNCKISMHKSGKP